MIISRQELDESDGRSAYSVFSAKEHENEVPRVEPLLPEHLDNAFESIEAAFKNDPVTIYINAGKERSPFEQELYKRFWKFQHKRIIKRKVTYTVNAGDAVIISTPPAEDTSKPSPVDRTIDFMVGSFVNFFLWAGSRQEQVKRFKELQSKTKKIYEAELGDRIKSMVYVDLLATKPEAQGHGFGTALLNTTLFSADIKGRAVYLTASNTSNVPFYESFGFVNISHFSLGEGNPKWENPPVIVTLMVREPKTKV